MSLPKFDEVAREYDAGRPDYPDELFDAIEDLTGTFFDGAKVADIGAGTGKATRAMLARGAVVIAADRGEQMLAVLRARSPVVPALLADANALPFVDASLDLVTFAQSWHWVDLERAPREVVRVVRPGGAIGLWWNVADVEGEESWLAEHRARLGLLSTNDVGSTFDLMWAAIPSAFANLDVETTQVTWHRTVSRDVILDEVRSKSYVVELGHQAAREFVERERALLPDAELRESFVTRLAVARVPG